MTDSHYIRRQRERTIARLIDEVRPLPTLDPGSDRPDYDDEQTRFLTVAGFQSAALTVLALHPDSLTPDELADIRRTIVALDNFISPLGG